MKQIPEPYKTLRSQTGSYYNVRVIAAGNTYGMDKLSKVNIDFALFDGSGPQIGNAYAAQCDLELYEDSVNWPRMCRFTVDVQLRSADGLQTSAWLPMGAFYTDTRSDNTYGLLTVHAYDGMLKFENSWTDKIPSAQLPTSWPITSRAYASMIQNANLAQFEDLTQLNNTVPLVGLDTSTTIRDVLKTIAAANGANWYMTANEKLRLVKFRNPPEITAEATTADYVYLGRSMKSLEYSPALVGISAVHLETMGGTEVYDGDNTGYQLNGSCEFSNTNGVAELCLGNVSGYVYKPFIASNAYLDLITEPGDIVVADENAYQVMRLSWQLGKSPIATIAADYDQEVDHEYTITSAQAKQYRKVMAATDEKIDDLQDEFSTAIQQTERQINLIAESTVTQTEFEAVVASLQDQIDGNIQSWSGNVVPTLNNSPANGWTTDAQKAEHVGDTYFVNTDAGIPESGQYYRFENNGGVYSWQLLDDSALSEALNRAAAALAAAETAQETADSASATATLKGRIFVNQPTPPYSVGDLWFDSAQSEIMTCMTARESGSYNSSDWVKRNKYTDDSAFEQFQSDYNATITAIQGQLDQKAETYYQEADPAANWGAAIAGIAVAGVTVIGISGGAGHGGDLWYRTSDNTTWFYDESNNVWVQQDVPEEVFDKIDGKAQIFIAEPYPPYNVGDLWFNSAQSEIMTCIHTRSTGSFVSSDWEKRNKYTDDTAANQAKEQLVQFKSEFSVQPSQIKAEVEKRVIKDKSDTKSSFGWVLSDTSHTWYANGNEVMKASQSGLEVKGKITATSGYIGNSSNGFTITATSIYNGKSTLTTDSNGVYIGTNGIALGAKVSGRNYSKFQVDSSGNFYATSATIEGSIDITSGSINIGNGAFSVDSSGNLTASNGTFKGKVYAKNIKYGTTATGYLPGGAISTGTITGGLSGTGAATGQLSAGVATSLGYANLFNSATVNGTTTYPAYFCASQIVALSSFYSSTYTVNTGNESTEYDLEDHYHTFTVDNNTGKVKIGKPTKTQGFFNIADTQTYKDGVSAAEDNAKANYISFSPKSPSTWNDNIAQPGNVYASGDHKYVRPQFNLESGHQEGNVKSYIYTPANVGYFYVDVTDIAGDDGISIGDIIRATRNGQWTYTDSYSHVYLFVGTEYSGTSSNTQAIDITDDLLAAYQEGLPNRVVRDRDENWEWDGSSVTVYSINGTARNFTLEG